MKKDIPSKCTKKKKKQVYVATLNIWQIDFKIKLIRKDKEGHYILIKENFCQESFAILKYLCNKQRVQRR